jgi:hypothetical protein
MVFFYLSHVIEGISKDKTGITKKEKRESVEEMKRKVVRLITVRGKTIILFFFRTFMYNKLRSNVSRIGLRMGWNGTNFSSHDPRNLSHPISWNPQQISSHPMGCVTLYQNCIENRDFLNIAY